MDNLPSQVLTKIYSFLPWNERITARRLSSKFLKVPEWKNYLWTLILREDENCFVFGLLSELKNQIARMIVIVKKNKEGEEPTVFKKDEKLYRTTIISCPESSQYHRFIDVYMDLIFDHYTFGTLELFNFSPAALSKITETRLKENAILKKEYPYWLEFHTSSSILSTEEKNLLKISKDHYSLRFFFPANFQIPVDFWELTPMSNLGLDFGLSGDKDGSIADVDMGITGDLIRQLIRRRQKAFMAPIVRSDISINSLMEYIEGAFLGEYMMLQFSVGHKFSRADVVRLWERLLVAGFEQMTANSAYFSKVVEVRKRAEGYDPDRIIVRICFRAFYVVADYACHRGKNTTASLL